ncbi:MAG: translocation/assembly module TamB domain-containing protein [Cyanobacteriota bacterium]
MAASALVLGVGVPLLNRELERQYLHYKAGLERQLGQAMGHPLRFGPYRGLSLEGLTVGPSHLGRSRLDHSHASVRGLTVGLDPLASLQQGVPVLRLTVSGAQVVLRSRPSGPLWVFGGGGGQPPRLGLQVRFRDPLALRLFSETARPLNLRGWTDLRFDQQQLRSGGQLAVASGGRLAFDAGGDWHSARWRFRFQPRQLDLAALLDLWPGRRAIPGRLDGRLDGRLRLELDGARRACQGRLQVSQGRWRGSAPDQTLEIPRLLGRCSSPLSARRPALAWQIDRLDWRQGAWRGQLRGALIPFERWDLQALASHRSAADPSIGRDQLRGRLSGPWRQPTLAVDGQLQARTLGLGATRLLPVTLTADLQQGSSLRVRRLDLRLAHSRLQARGSLAPTADLRGQATIAPRDLPLDSRWQALLQPVQVRFAWTPAALQLDEMRSGPVWVSGRIPLQRRAGRGLVAGPVALNLEVATVSLPSLQRALGLDLQGSFTASGQLSGPLAQLQPRLMLTVQDPGLGPVHLAETWSGELSADPAGVRRLLLRSSSELTPGTLQAAFDSRWRSTALRLERGRGWLAGAGPSPMAGVSTYSWQGQALPLDGLQIALGPKQRLRPLQGEFSGRGQLVPAPWRLTADLALRSPSLLGVKLSSADLRLGMSNGRFAVESRARIPDGGSLHLVLRRDPQRPGGRGLSELQGTLAARDLQSEVLHQLAEAVPLWRGEAAEPTGRAGDLGVLMIDTLGRSLTDQLQALSQAQERLRQRQQRQAIARRGLRFDDLPSRVDADLTLSTPRPDQLWIELTTRAHLWWPEEDQDRAMTLEPLVARLSGPLADGGGRFSFDRLPLSLLALLTPVPATLRGFLGLQGRYRLGSGLPDVQADLSLQQAAVADMPLSLSRARIRLDRQALWQVNGSLLAPGRSGSLDLQGQIPLDPRRTDLKVRLQGREDGLRFLTALAGPAISLDQGSADLLLLLRGSVAEPLAHGVLRIERGQLRAGGQTIRDLQTLVVFDFNALEVQSLSGSIGGSGSFRGQGRLGLVQWYPQVQPLQITLRAVPVRGSRLTAQLDGEVTVTGSLREPGFGGSLQLSRGRVNAQPGELSRPDGAGGAVPVTVPRLLEQNWAFDRPWRVFGSDVETDAGQSLRAAIPSLPFISLRRLVLRFGPDLRLVVPGLANFTTGGSLLISGRLDPSLQLSGVVRLLNGRLNLFTTSFSLDPDSPNVAVFTPSLGLIPYVDVALRTRVSDTVNIGQRQSGSLTSWDLQSTDTPLDQLRLVRVTLQASGPADRLVDQIRLRSSPPLPEDRLVALIGGNSLAGLSSGNAGTALATVVGQTLLTPLVGSLTEAFGQRFSFALFPTYVVPAVNDASEGRSGRVPSELVLGSEIGVDLNDRFNLSVLAAPNRSDIPPQVTLRYQASDRLGLQGSVDGQGRWQTQMQIFLRF